MKCFLKYISSDEFSDKQQPRPAESIELTNGKSIILGRSSETRIINPRCSKKQVELKANFNKRTVSVKQIGPNNSSVNSEPIGIGLDVVAKVDDIINFLHENNNCSYMYKICFEEDEQDKAANIKKSPVKSTPPPAVNEVGPKPVKIPKMFTDCKKSSKGSSTSFGSSTAVPIANSFLKNPVVGGGTWESIEDGQLLVYSYKITTEDSIKESVSAFDLDGTIITTKSGRVFPKDETDWKFLYNNTVPKLQSFINQRPDTRFFIISNQAGLNNKPQEIPGFKRKVETIVNHFGIPTIVFALPGKTKFRKPLPYLWYTFVEKYNGGKEPDRSESFYCGDAAGRKKDFSKSDRLFALNLGLNFKTPEEFFLGQKPKPNEFSLPEFDPPSAVPKAEKLTNDDIEFPTGQEMIILIGYPGSGKSSIVKNMLEPRGYVHINRDTLKTQAKCLSTTGKTLEDGQSVVIDNTNPKKRDRTEYIKIAKKHGIPVRCFKMDVSFSHASHNNKFRQLTDTSHASIPEVAFNTYKAQYEEPELNEGIDEIVSVNFIPTFKTKELKELYSKYLLEK